MAAVPGSGDVVLATNGTQIMRSANSGCTWNPVYTLAEGYLGHNPGGVSDSGQGGSYAIMSFGVPRYGQAKSVYAIAAVEGYAPTGATQLVAAPPILTLKSADAGASWQLVNPAPSASALTVPRCTSPTLPNYALRTAVAASDANTMYVVCGTFAFVDGAARLATSSGNFLIYESTDGGSSWVQRTSPIGGSGGVPLQGLAIDSTDPSKIWLATTRSDGYGASAPTPTPTLWYSADSGQHWVSRATGRQVKDPRFQYKLSSSIAELGAFGVDSAPTSGVAALALGNFGALQVASSGSKPKLVGWRAGAIAVHAVYAPNGDLLVVQDFGVPHGYGAPYCDNVSSSWEQLTRYHNGKTELLPSPGTLIADFYGLQSAGASTTSIYGYGLLKSSENSCSSPRNVLLSWKSDR